jgi:hypothetical protein
LTLFCFGKWQGSGNNKNATAQRSFNNLDESLRFLNPTIIKTNHRPWLAIARSNRTYQEPFFRLIADKNSWRVLAWVLNIPNIQLVTIVTSDLWTPLVVMHSWAASTTTPTPKGFSTLLRHLAISDVIFS